MSDFDAREQGRRAALAGRPIFANPHIAGEAVLWFMGYRSVPDDQRGNWPELLPRSKRRGTKRTRSADAQVRALGDRTLPGSTPRPMQEAIASDVEEARARTPKPWADGVGL